ncbi:hypothetical protein [Aeromonas sp. NJAU223]|uniref:hypothetical protein n=1 Tax=Aeromonas sp. NJAU223 TaxID=3115650 RepID=UPI003DA810DE
MDILKQWMAGLLLVLISFGAGASSPLLQLVLADKTVVTLDEAALAALPEVEFKTATPWTTGVHSYRGPTLASLLASQGLKQVSIIDVIGLNGYRQRLDLSLFSGIPLTVTRFEDDKPLTRRNKGPLWLLMPFSAYPALDLPTIHSYMVWQLIRLEVVQ